jgi:hypothetical protein
VALCLCGNSLCSGRTTQPLIIARTRSTDRPGDIQTGASRGSDRIK